jgi:probable rRNA maturation factor
VRAIAERMLHALDLADAELSVLLTDDRTIRDLNRAHRGKDKPTDVLAFPLDLEDGDNGAAEAGDGSGAVLGDVVISLDTAARQARSRNRELLAEVRFLLAHGVLHLVGYDHATRPEKQIMDRLTRRLVRAAAP